MSSIECFINQRISFLRTVELVPEITRASCVRASARRCYAGAFGGWGGGGKGGVHGFTFRDFGGGRQAGRRIGEGILNVEF